MREILRRKRLAAGFESMSAAAEAAGITRQEWAAYERTNTKGTIPKWEKIQKVLGLSSAEVWDIIHSADGEDRKPRQEAYFDGLIADWSKKGYIAFSDSRIQYLFYRQNDSEEDLFLTFGFSATANNKESVFLLENHDRERLAGFFESVAAKVPAMRYAKVTGLGDELRANTKDQVAALEKEYRSFILDDMTKKTCAKDIYKKRAEEALESGLGLAVVISTTEDGLIEREHKVIRADEEDTRAFLHEVIRAAQEEDGDA